MPLLFKYFKQFQYVFLNPLVWPIFFLFDRLITKCKEFLFRVIDQIHFPFLSLQNIVTFPFAGS